MKINQMNKHNYKTYRRIITAIAAASISITCDVLGIPGGFEKAIGTAVIIALCIQFYAQKHLLD